MMARELATDSHNKRILCYAVQWKLLCYVRGSGKQKEYNARKEWVIHFMDKQTQLLHTQTNESEQSLKNDKMNLGVKAEKIQWIRCRGFKSWFCHFLPMLNFLLAQFFHFYNGGNKKCLLLMILMVVKWVSICKALRLGSGTWNVLVRLLARA